MSCDLYTPALDLYTQQTNKYSKSTIEILLKGVKYV